MVGGGRINLLFPDRVHSFSALCCTVPCCTARLSLEVADTCVCVLHVPYPGISVVWQQLPEDTSPLRVCRISCRQHRRTTTGASAIFFLLRHMVTWLLQQLRCSFRLSVCLRHVPLSLSLSPLCAVPRGYSGRVRTGRGGGALTRAWRK